MAKKKLTITVSDELYDKLDEVAKAMGLTKNSLCTYIVANHLYVSQEMMKKNELLIADKEK